MKNLKRILIFVILLVNILSLFACGVNNQNSTIRAVTETTMASRYADTGFSSMNAKMTVNDTIEEAYYDVEMGGGENTRDRKIIKTVNLNAETKTFDDSVIWLKSFINKYDGIIDNSYVDTGNMSINNYRKNAHFSARIPAEKVDEFLGKIGSNLNVTFRQENISDITEEYSDSESRLKSLNIEEEKLNELLKSAKTVDEMIKVEDKLSSVRAEIERITKRIKRFDNNVTYSTVNIEIMEVKDLTEPATGEEDYSRETLVKQLKKNTEEVKKFLKKLGANIFTNIPWIVFILTVILIITIFYAIFKTIFLRKGNKENCNIKDNNDKNQYKDVNNNVDLKNDIEIDGNIKSNENDHEEEVEVEIYQ